MSWKLRRIIALLALCVWAFVAARSASSHSVFWPDEVGFAEHANLGLTSLVKYFYETKVNCFGYQTLVWSLTRLGMSRSELRLSSLAFWLGSVVLVNGLSRTLLNRRAALFSALVFASTPALAISSFRISYLPLLVFCCALAVFSFLRFSRSLQNRWLWGVAAAGAIGASAHFVGGLWAGALLLGAFKVLPGRSQRTKFGISVIPALAVTATCLGTIYRQSGSAKPEFRLPSLLPNSVMGIWGGLILAVSLTILGWSLLASLRRKHEIRNWNATVALSLAGAAFVAGEFVLSSLRPDFGGPCLFPALVVFAINFGMFGEISTGTFSTLLRYGLVFMLISGSVVAYRSAMEGSLADLAVKVFALSKPGDAIVFADALSRAEFEGERPSSAQYPVPVYPAEPWGASGKITWSKGVPVQVFEQVADTQKRLWFVASDGNPEKNVDVEVFKHMKSNRTLSNHAGVIRLYVFVQ